MAKRAPTTEAGSQRHRKPLHQRWWIWVVGIFVLLFATGLYGRATGAGDTDRTVKAEKTSEQVTVPDVIGSSGDEARQVLREADLKVEFVDGSDEDRNIVRRSNWQVDSSDPAPNKQVTVGDTITLTVSKPEDQEESTETPGTNGKTSDKPESQKERTPKEKDAPKDSDNEKPEPTPTTPSDKFDFDYYQGEVTVNFDIDDNFSTGLVASGAKRDTIEALELAVEKYPDYKSIVVMGSGPTVDKYGNEDNSYLFSVRYTRETVEKIDFDNSALIDIWDLRDAGMVNPDLDK